MATVGPSSGPPGAVIAHRPAHAGQYLGSPSLAILPDGTLAASHDIFGPNRPEPRQTLVYASPDAGMTWEHRATLERQYWSTLFVHGEALYLMGTTTGLGALVIRRSSDGGRSWTTPEDAHTGLLFEDGQFHTAPVPVVRQGDRIWRAAEELLDPGEWPTSLSPFLMSAPVDADLLRASSWTRTPPLRFDPSSPGRGWMEGNAVVGPEGQMLTVLRVDVPRGREHAAILELAPGTGELQLTEDAFPELPGAAKKFSIRRDPETGRYFTLVNEVGPDPVRLPAAVRNRLAIASSRDLRAWTLHAVLLSHEDAEHHGFQYADFAFDADDLVFVSRTAHDDRDGGADDYHNANYITFHRLVDFRSCVHRRLEPRGLTRAHPTGATRAGQANTSWSALATAAGE